ncbi:MAG: M56 family metallopeptidase [Mariniblastus sp.]
MVCRFALVHCFTVLLAGRYFHLRAIINRTTEPTSELQNLFDKCRQKFGFTGRVRLRISSDMETPGMTGVFRSVILLPTWAESELSQEQLVLVFIHEQIHIRNFDGIVQLISYVISMLHWFNPFVHIALRRIDSCRELGCDQQVLTTLGDDRKTQRLYGQTILQIAERSSGQRNISPVLVGGFIGNDNKLIKQRIAMLINSKPPRRLGTAIFAACFLALVAIGFTHAQTQDPVELKEPQVTKVKSSGQDAVTTDDKVEQPEEVDFDPETPIGIQVETDMVVKFDFKIAEVMIEDPKLLKCRPVSSSSLMFTGLKPGVNSVFVSEPSILPDGRRGEILNRRQLVIYVTYKDTDDKEQTKKLNAQLEQRANKLLKDSAAPIEPENGKIYSIEAGSSRRVKCGFRIPEISVDAPEIVSVTPVSPSELLITALKIGESTVSIWNEKREVITFTIVVKPNVHKLNRKLSLQFPNESVRLSLIGTNKIQLKGDVSNAKQKEAIIAFAKTHVAEVVDELGVRDRVSGGGVKIAYQVKVYEVATAKLQALGIDFTKPGASKRDVSGFADLIAEPLAIGQHVMIDNLGQDPPVLKTLDALVKHGVAVLKDQPVLVGEIGRPAEFTGGREIPIKTNEKIEFRLIGTKLELLAVNKKGKMILEIKSEFSQVDNSLPPIDGVPCFRVRRCNTGVHTNMGDTIAIVLDSKTAEGKDAEIVFLITPRPIKKVAVANKPEESSSDF